MANLYRGAMDMARLEEQSLSESPAARLHTGVKLAVTVLYVGLVVSLPVSSPGVYWPYCFIPVFFTAWSGTPLRFLLKRLGVALPFSLMGGISRLFLYRETAFLLMGRVAVSTGMLSFSAILLKTLLTVWAVLLLSATTPMTDIVRQLAAARLPGALCLTFDMIARYASVLLAEAAALHTAYTLRAGGRRGLRAGDFGGLLGQWLLRSFDRAERIYQAMGCRGFTGDYRYGGRPICRADIIFLVTVSAVLLFLRIGGAVI